MREKERRREGEEKRKSAGVRKGRERGAYAENNSSHLLRDVLASWW